MSSKKTKSTKESKVDKKSPSKKKSYQHELVAPDCWVNELAKIDINDDRWKCSVTIIEEESTDSTVYMEHFNESTINGNRLSVKTISKLEVVHYVVKNMSENHPNKSLTPLAMLCSEIFKLVGPEFNTNIPTPLLASLIKYIILEFKDLNKKIREGMEKRKKEVEEYQQSLWQIPAKSISSKGTKSSNMEKKGNKLDNTTKVKTVEKPFTKLRKRGEEWKDKTWIDDSPPDGPQLYIAISTFYDPDLPLELLNLNIPLHAIAKLGLWEKNPTTDPTEFRYIFQSLQDFRYKSTPHLNSTVRKRLGSETEKAESLNFKISSFWKTIHKLKTELPTALMFKNVMFLIFTPNHFSFQYNIKSFQEEIYKQLSYFLYDVHEITKQHIQYLNETKQIKVNIVDPCELSNMKIYNSLLDSIPHEVLSIPFLLDALVNQVCGLENEIEPEVSLLEIEKTNEKFIPVASNFLTMLLKQLNLKYDLVKDNFNVFNEEESKNSIDTCNIKHVLKHFDDKNINTFHLHEDIAEFVRKRIAHILQVAWKNIILDLFSTPHNDDNIVRLCSDIIKTAKESGENILNYYIYIVTVNSILNSLLIHDFSYSSLKMSSLKESVHYDKENMCENCMDEVYNEMFSISRNKVSNLSSISSKTSPYKLSDVIVESNLFHVEYMTKDVMLQWIQTAWYNFNKFESRYCTFTNQVVIVFHNLLDPKVGAFEGHWVGKLRTHVPIRDFVEFVLEEEKEWLSQFCSKSTVESSKLDKPVTFHTDKLLPEELPFLFPEYQFISHRSLKYETILKQQKSTNQFTTLSNEKSKSIKTKTVSKKTDSSKSSKVKDKQKDKKVSEIKSVLLDNFKVETTKENYTFCGYDLGDPMRFQFSGLKKEKILDDCCRLTLQTMGKLYGEQSQSLTVTISGHSLYYMYKPYCESTLINPFHLVLSSGIVLYFGLSNKETGTFDHILKTYQRSNTNQDSMLLNSSVLGTEFIAQKPVLKTSGEDSNFLRSNDLMLSERNSSSCFRHTFKGVPYFEIPLTYDLKVSLPNGVHIEVAKENSLLYIRQTLLSRSMLAKCVENDKLRCYLSNGCIVKFLLNDTIEILCPNGLLYTVFESKKEPFRSGQGEAIEPNEGTILNTAISEISVRKNKKTSLKENTDESSKSSKIKTVLKNGSKSTDSQTPNATVTSFEETHAQEMEENTNLTNSFDFECTTSDGKKFTVQNNKVTQVLKNLLITHTTNVAENCIDSERTDGVSTKHFEDGSLLVQFTDGSRITSTPLEAGEEFCEWSTEELKQWFSDLTEARVVASGIKTETSLSKQSEGSYVVKENSFISRNIEETLAVVDSFHKADSVPSGFSPNGHEKKLKMSLLEESDIKSDVKTINSKTSKGTLLTSMTDQDLFKKPFYHDDGFVVYRISYLMEHPNYSSVYYNANNCDVELKLPLNNKITLKNDGCYEAYFGKANLTVESDEIFFGKISECEDFERTVIINNSATNNKNPVSFTNYFNSMNSLPLSVEEFCQNIGLKSFLNGMVMETETEIKSGLLLYCVDAKMNEVIVDYDFNIYELQAVKDKYLIPGNGFNAVVINENLSGFRLVSDEEAKRHVQVISEQKGLVQETENTWKSILTTIPIAKNESEKWLLNYQKNLSENTKTLLQTSTYGKRESWIQPFVEKEEEGHRLVEYKAVIVRLLHRIPAKENILDKLKVAVENYSKKTKKEDHIRILLDEFREDFISLDELIRSPKILCKIINDENTKKNIDEDQFRSNMKHNFVRSLINKAIIKARKIRKQNKELELKSALRRKEIPPYHLSGFGYVHSILEEMFENSTSVFKTSSSMCIKSCEKVNFIIDELLGLVSKTKLGSPSEEFSDDIITNETDSIGIKSLVSGIFRNVCALTQDRNSQIHINAILEKPLKLVTSDDIAFISKLFGSGDCPILYDEEFILQDVLDARLQLSNYFENLRSMLEFYRGVSTTKTSLLWS